jgi:hypothetical protein
MQQHYLQTAFPYSTRRLFLKINTETITIAYIIIEGTQRLHTSASELISYVPPWINIQWANKQLLNEVEWDMRKY